MTRRRSAPRRRYTAPPVSVARVPPRPINGITLSPMVIGTRKATEADTPFARKTHHAAYRDVVVAQFGQWDEEAQDRFFENDWRGTSFDILLCNGEPCGYAAVEERPTDVHVRELVIHPAFQSRGIGTAFLRSVMAHAAARGVPVHLGTFHRNRALSLYERLGFREIEKTASHVVLEWARTRRCGGPR